MGRRRPALRRGPYARTVDRAVEWLEADTRVQNAARIGARFALDPLTVLGNPSTVAALPHSLKARIRLAAALVCQSDERKTSGQTDPGGVPYGQLVEQQERLDRLEAER